MAQANRLSGKQRSPRIRLVKGDDVQVVTSEGQAVALEFKGYARQEAPSSKKGDTPPPATN